MKRFSEQLHTKAMTVKLQAAERKELRERVVSYMEYHPLPKEQKRKKALAPVYQGDAFTLVRVPFSLLAKWSAAVAVLVLVIIPVMAEDAVPGDGLYAVKVRFNEEVRGTLATTPYEKIEWETERLNRRIAEARLLASEGRLTDEVEAEVAAAVKEHTENAQREIEILRTQDEDEAILATIALNTTLQVQSASFRSEEAATELYGDDSHTPSLLASVIDETLSKQEAAGSSTVPAYEKLLARIEINTTRAHELLSALALAEDSQVKQDITRRMEDIERQLGEALALRETDDHASRLKLLDSLQRTQRLIVFMTEVEVGKELAVEEIVPVILTPEEQKTAMEQYRHDIKKQIDIIELMLDSGVTGAGIEGKATQSVVTMKEAELKIASSTDYVEVKTVAEETLALAADTIAFLQQHVVKQPELPDEGVTEEPVEAGAGEEPPASASPEEVQSEF